MILIQDGSQPPNIDKPLRIIGDPYKVQVLFYILWTCAQIILQNPGSYLSLSSLASKGHG